MSVFDQMKARARGRQARIALIGQGDGSVEAAGERLVADGIGSVTIIGEGGIDPGTDSRLGGVAETLRQCWPERVRDGIHALDLAAHPLLFAAGLTARGDLDVCLGGTAMPVDAMEEAARWVTGPERGGRGRGSLGYLAIDNGMVLTLAIPDSAGPLDTRGVASLALSAANHRSRVVGDSARVGLLVPPPSQDASHADAELALAQLRELAPGLEASVEWGWTFADGTDAARLRQGPNVLIFPDPVSGHLAQLLLRDAGGRKTWGPLHAGGPWTLASVPEGANTDDVVSVAIVAAAGLASS